MVGVVNPAGVRGRRWIFPREISGKACHRGGEVSRGHSRPWRRGDWGGTPNPKGGATDNRTGNDGRRPKRWKRLIERRSRIDAAAEESDDAELGSRSAG